MLQRFIHVRIFNDMLGTDLHSLCSMSLERALIYPKETVQCFPKAISVHSAGYDFIPLSCTYKGRVTSSTTVQLLAACHKRLSNGGWPAGRLGTSGPSQKVHGKSCAVTKLSPLPSSLQGLQPASPPLLSSPLFLLTLLGP